MGPKGSPVFFGYLIVYCLIRIINLLLFGRIPIFLKFNLILYLLLCTLISKIFRVLCQFVE